MGIKQDDPELAILLKEDDFFNALKEQCDATVRFSVSDSNKFMQSGQKIFEEKRK